MDNIKRINVESKKTFPESNWVWSPQGVIATHQPETWGDLQFSDTTVGTNNIPFSFNADEICKWERRKIYYSQNDIKLKYGYYSSNIIGINSILSACIIPVIQPVDTIIGYQY